jgi:photosystem II stability/assembly factor-like uncharacterized protein
MFAGTFYGGVFRSTDSGASWTATDSLFLGKEIVFLIEREGTVMAGTPVDGVFQSTDVGITWSQANFGIGGIRSIVSCGSDLIASTSSRLLISADGGLNWTLTNATLTSVTYTSLLTIDSCVFAGTWGNGVFRSTNRGVDWAEASEGLSGGFSRYVYSLATNGTTLFAGALDGFYASSNLAVSWEARGPQAAMGSGGMVVCGDTIFAGSNAMVWRSTDGGSTWAGSNVTQSNTYVTSLALIGSVLFAGTRGSGVYASLDDGLSWTQANSGFRESSVRGLLTVHSDIFAATGNGVFRSSDGGMHWIQTCSGLAELDISCLAGRDSVLFAGVEWGLGGMYLSKDGSLSWARVDSNMFENSITCLLVKGATLFAGVHGSIGVLVSTDDGHTWRETGANFGAALVKCLGSCGEDLYAGLEDGGLFCSTNGGTDWTRVTVVPPSTSVNCLVSRGDELFVGTTGQGIFHTTDRGTHWRNLSPWGYWTFFCLAMRGDTLYGGSGMSAAMSVDSGQTWWEVSAGLGTLRINSLSVSGDNLLAGTDVSGVWARPLSEMVVSVGSPSRWEARAGFSLDQNYPNPFNPSTTIKYELSRTSHVNMSVYDMLGRQVSVLVKERKDAGVHEVRFDGVGLASGVYFYKLQAGDFVQTRKLVLMK